MSNAIRKIILDQSHRRHVGHIGSCLSIADIVGALYDHVLPADYDPASPDRDRVVLSKGHAALAIYAALRLRDIISQAELDKFLGDESYLAVHPEHQLPGIDFTSGSLGQGLSVAAGCALAAKMQKSDRKVYVIMSDAELNEGSTWEAAMFAAHHKLDNLVVILDSNQQQALGFTKDVMHLANLSQRWEMFDWQVHSVDGHDHAKLAAAMQNLSTDGKPTMVIANTTFGKGVSYMESKIRWHYMPMSEEEYQQAVSELGY